MATIRPPGLRSLYQFRKASSGCLNVHSTLRLTTTSKLPAGNGGAAPPPPADLTPCPQAPPDDASRMPSERALALTRCHTTPATPATNPVPPPTPRRPPDRR